MLTLESALTLFRKYDFNSTTSFPYLFSSDNNVGLVFLYYDDDYGTLQRAKIFDNEEILEDFLKKYRWYLDNGLSNNVRMVLDDYEIMNPHVIFLRNNIAMVKGEMFDLEGFKLREAQIEQLDLVSRAVFEAGNLLLIYDSIKSKQVKRFESAKTLNNQLRQLYFNLQKEVDIYNGIKLDRELILQKQTTINPSVNELMEISIKDRYNQYRTTLPTLEEANAFVQEVWDLLLSIEVDSSLYQVEASCNNMRWEMDVVQKKYNLVHSLNQSDDKFHKVDLVKRFRTINNESEASSIKLDSSYINKRTESIKRKYGYINTLDFNSLSEYLRECDLNNNYDVVALKYKKGSKVNKDDISINGLASNIFSQYRDNISVENQAMLILYNSIYRQLIDLVLNVPDLTSKTNEEVFGLLSKVKGITKIKNECYEQVKRGFLNPANQNIQGQLFSNVNFETFDLFMISMIDKIKKFKLSNRIAASGNCKLFFLAKNENEFINKKFIVLTNDINSVKQQITSPKDFIGVATLFKNTPLLYSPYYVDFDFNHAKDVQPVYAIKELGKLELLIQKDDVNCFIDDTITYVNEYASNPTLVEDVSMVSELTLVNKLNFYKVAFVPKENVVINNQPPVVQNEQPVSANIVSEPVKANVVNNVSDDKTNISEQPVEDKVVTNSDVSKEEKEEETKKNLKVEIKVSDNPYSDTEFPKVKEDKEENKDGNE